MATSNAPCLLQGNISKNEVEAQGDETQETLADVLNRPLRTGESDYYRAKAIPAKTAQELAAAFGTSPNCG